LLGILTSTLSPGLKLASVVRQRMPSDVELQVKPPNSVQREVERLGRVRAHGAEAEAPSLDPEPGAGLLQLPVAHGDGQDRGEVGGGVAVLLDGWELPPHATMNRTTPRALKRGRAGASYVIESPSG
jgi:hypothetical protein